MSIRRNSLYNLAGALAPLAVTLITVPIYLRLIGVDRYGTLAIGWLLLGYFGVFDLGLSRATAQIQATLHKADPHARASAFWTALALNSGFGVLGGVIFWLAGNWFVASHLNAPDALRPEILAALPWLAAAVPLTTTFGVLTGALQGRERFLALNFASVAGSVLSQLLPLLVAWLHGPDLALLVPAALLGRALVFVLVADQCRRHVPLTGRPSISTGLVPRLFRYGGWVTVSGLIGPLLVVSDQFVIGAVAGVAAVTYYSIPFNLAIRVTILPGSLAAALFPRLAATDDSSGQRLAAEAVRILSVVLTPLIIAGLIMMEPFLAWWLDLDFAGNSATVGEILLIGFWANCLAYIPATKLQAEGRPDLVAKCHLSELLPYFVLLYFCLLQWGIVGAAIAWTVRVSVDCVLLFALSGERLHILRSLLLPATLLGLGAFSVLVLPVGGTLVCVGAFLASLVWAWFVRPPSLAAWMRAPLRNVALRG